MQGTQPSDVFIEELLVLLLGFIDRLDQRRTPLEVNSFAGRRCRRVRYTSQSETKADRANRAMFKIVKRLDPKEQCNDLPWKPKGMHWRTYNRLAERYQHYDAQWALEAMRRFGIKL